MQPGQRLAWRVTGLCGVCQYMGLTAVAGMGPTPALLEEAVAALTGNANRLACVEYLRRYS